SHFGLAVGGNDLDRALAARIATILRKAASFPAIAEQFEIEGNLPLAPSDSFGLDEREREAGLRFLSELQAAKARLSERLLVSTSGARHSMNVQPTGSAISSNSWDTSCRGSHLPNTGAPFEPSPPPISYGS